MLTEKQKELLLFIHARMQEKGVPPSFDEMKDALDLKSKSGIHRLITALVERGFIRRLPHRARAIEVIRLPENQAAPTAASPKRSSGGFQPSVFKRLFTRLCRLADQFTHQLLQLGTGQFVLKMLRPFGVSGQER